MLACYVSTITLIVRREMAGNALTFAEDLPLYEDWECFARLSRAGNAAYLDCETAWNYEHVGKRLTHADTLRYISARIKILERVWGSDKLFPAKYGRYYNKILIEQRLIKAKELNTLGKTRKARSELLRMNHNAPLSCSFLASMPGTIAK
jgi:hypothetical protein